MATASSKLPSGKNVPGADAAILVTNFFNTQDDELASAVDPLYLVCKTDRGCRWIESCEDAFPDPIEIDGAWYWTWRPKGIRDDDPDPGGYGVNDYGEHVHLSCNRTQTGVKIDGNLIVSILEEMVAVGSPYVAQFCTWVFENCFETDQFMGWVCDTIINHCMPDSDFTEAFCEWFVDFVLTDPICRDELINWFITEPGLVPVFCQTMVQCFNRPTIINEICLVIVECLQDPDVRNDLCDVVRSCLETEIFLSDKICSIVKDHCITTDTWDSSIDPDPVGDSATGTYLVDTDNGCITSICVNGVWTCVPTPPAPPGPPTYAPVITDGVFQCPVPFPVIYNTVLYNDAATLAAALTAQYGCSVTYNPPDCTMCFPWSCVSPPTQVDVTTPAAPPTTYAPVITDGAYQCPVPFPVIYNTVLYANQTELATALTIQYGCPVTYLFPSCDMCFPPECATAPTQIDVTTPVVIPCPNNGDYLELGGEIGSSVNPFLPPSFRCIEWDNQAVPGRRQGILYDIDTSVNPLCSGLTVCFDMTFIDQTSGQFDVEMDIGFYPDGQQLNIIDGLFPLAPLVPTVTNPASGIYCAVVPDFSITGPQNVGLFIRSVAPGARSGDYCSLLNSVTVT